MTTCAGEVFGWGQDIIIHSNNCKDDHSLHSWPSYCVENGIGYDRSSSCHHFVHQLQEGFIGKIHQVSRRKQQISS